MYLCFYFSGVVIAGGWSKIKEFGGVIQNCHLVVVLVLLEDNDTRSLVGFCYEDVFIHPERLDGLKTFFCHLEVTPFLTVLRQISAQDQENSSLVQLLLFIYFTTILLQAVA